LASLPSQTSQQSRAEIQRQGYRNGDIARGISDGRMIGIWFLTLRDARRIAFASRSLSQTLRLRRARRNFRFFGFFGS
jgi:hypothetical protein